MNRIEFLANLDKYKGEDHSTFLQHYGILGQKWGQRRWQNPDGTFNAEGKQRYFGQKSNNTSSEEKIGGYTADHFHKNIYLKTDKNTLKKIKKYPDIYDTEGLTDDEILKAIRRVPKIPNARAYGREIREELYNAQLNKTRSKYYETNTKDIPESEDIEDQKIGGLFNKTPEEKNAKKLAKEAKELEKELTSKLGDIKNYPDRKKIEAWLDKPENKELVDSYINAYDNKYNKMSKEINELFKDYDEHEDKYVAKAAIYEALESDGDNLGNISSIVHWFITDDGDQGSRNSEAYYLQEKGMKPEEINELWNRQINVEKEARADAKNAINNTVISKLNPDLQYYVDSELFWKYARKDGYTSSKIGNASEAEGQDPEIVKKTQEITKKLEPSCGDDYTGWVALNAALDELNFSNKDYTELSDSDWNKINDKVKEIKAKYN